MLCAVKKLFLQKLSLSYFRFPIQWGFGDQPGFSIFVPHCLCLFWVLELYKRKASHCRTSACEGKFLELLAQATNVFPQSLEGILRRDLSLMEMPKKV